MDKSWIRHSALVMFHIRRISRLWSPYRVCDGAEFKKLSEALTLSTCWINRCILYPSIQGVYYREDSVLVMSQLADDVVFGGSYGRRKSSNHVNFGRSFLAEDKHWRGFYRASEDSAGDFTGGLGQEMGGGDRTSRLADEGRDVGAEGIPSQPQSNWLPVLQLTAPRHRTFPMQSPLKPLPCVILSKLMAFSTTSRDPRLSLWWGKAVVSR